MLTSASRTSSTALPSRDLGARHYNLKEVAVVVGKSIKLIGTNQ